MTERESIHPPGRKIINNDFSDKQTSRRVIKTRTHTKVTFY